MLKHSICHLWNKDKDLVIIDYDNSSPRFDEIVRDCRALILDDNLNLVARSFRRFFNLSEVPDGDGFCFDEPFQVCDKEDGSLINLYHYKGEWRVNTRFSFADSQINASGVTWKDRFFGLLGKTIEKLDTHYNYIFELCTPENRVVKNYDEPCIILLAIFNGQEELKREVCEHIAKEHGLKIAKSTICRTIDEIYPMLDNRVADDKMFEGFVLRDNYDNRIKAKSWLYISVHYSLSHGKTNDQSILEFIVNNEDFNNNDFFEYVSYFPDIQKRIEFFCDKLEKFEKYIYEHVDFFSSNMISFKEMALSVNGNPNAGTIMSACRGQKVRDMIKNKPKRYSEVLIGF